MAYLVCSKYFFFDAGLLEGELSRTGKGESEICRQDITNPKPGDPAPPGWSKNASGGSCACCCCCNAPVFAAEAAGLLGAPFTLRAKRKDSQKIREQEINKTQKHTHTYVLWPIAPSQEPAVWSSWVQSQYPVPSLKWARDTRIHARYMEN